MYIVKYEIYHQIAETLSFNMVYNLLLKVWDSLFIRIHTQLLHSMPELV